VPQLPQHVRPGRSLVLPMPEPRHLPQQLTAEACAQCIVRHGCNACFEELVRRYQSPLLHYLNRRTGSREEAEDLLQDVFLIVHRSLREYQPSWRFSTWIFTIANRLAVSHWRRKQVMRSANEQLRQRPSIEPSQSLQADEMRSRLWDIANEVLEADALAGLWLSYVESMSAEEIGHVLERSANAVRILLFRARAKLQQRLGPAWQMMGDPR
jgi:RNA polymerase sigma-70 factor, ECF subfamily